MNWLISIVAGVFEVDWAVALKMSNGFKNIPANVKHWHGAAPDCWFQHIALEVPGTETSNEWCEPVDAAAYAEATK